MCQAQLTRRQQLMSRDYRVSYGLAKACKVEITENGCRRGVRKGEDGYLRSSQILLCLEGVLSNEQGAVNGACVAQMRQHRQMLMEDLNVSPEVVVLCKDEVREDLNVLEMYCNWHFCEKGTNQVFWRARRPHDTLPDEVRGPETVGKRQMRARSFNVAEGGRHRLGLEGRSHLARKLVRCV